MEAEEKINNQLLEWHGEPKDYTSWKDHVGILITANEAELLLEKIVDLELKNKELIETVDLCIKENKEKR